MSPRRLAPIAAFTSLSFGAGGLIVPDLLAAAFGLQLDAAGVVLARLACASYVAFGVLNWLGRSVVDPPALRAITIGNGAAWALSAAVVSMALLSGVGSAAAWALVGLQGGFTIAWVLAYIRVADGSATTEAVTVAAGGTSR